jgi:hypothetical protein
MRVEYGSFGSSGGCCFLGICFASFGSQKIRQQYNAPASLRYESSGSELAKAPVGNATPWNVVWLPIPIHLSKGNDLRLADVHGQ